MLKLRDEYFYVEMTVMEKLKVWFKEPLKNTLTFIKWCAFACVAGVLIGGVGALFHYGIYYATELRTAQPWLILLLPAAGMVIVALYKVCGMAKDKGTNFVLVAVRSNEKLSWKTAPLIFVSTIITHLFGGSAGREGAALQIGGSIGAGLGRIFKLDDKDERIITMCGMSAAFAALFGTPVTATAFAMEVTSVGVMYYSALVPCILSSVIGVSIASVCGIAPTHYVISQIPDTDIATMLRVIALGVLCALLSILFCCTTQKAAQLYHKFFSNHYVRIIVGGVIVIGLTYLCGTYDYNGAGTHVIENALSGESRPEAFALKLIFTALTLGAGFKGGEIVPVFFTGSTFGNVAGRLLGLAPAFGGAIGLVSVFCGVTNCAITSFFLSIELFGTQGLMYFAVSCAVSYMLSGYYSLYKEQKIVYSKTRPEFIDTKAK